METVKYRVYTYRGGRHTSNKHNPWKRTFNTSTCVMCIVFYFRYFLVTTTFINDFAKRKFYSYL